MPYVEDVIIFSIVIIVVSSLQRIREGERERET